MVSNVKVGKLKIAYLTVFLLFYFAFFIAEQAAVDGLVGDILNLHMSIW